MWIKRCRLGLALWVLIAGLLTFSALAQDITSGITGEVTDPSGGVVVGAKVVARNTATGLVFTTATNKSGIYNIASLPPGLRAEHCSQVQP
jgi:hypothetical protein